MLGIAVQLQAVGGLALPHLACCRGPGRQPSLAHVVPMPSSSLPAHNGKGETWLQASHTYEQRPATSCSLFSDHRWSGTQVEGERTCKDAVCS